MPHYERTKLPLSLATLAAREDFLAHYLCAEAYRNSATYRNAWEDERAARDEYVEQLHRA